MNSSAVATFAREPFVFRKNLQIISIFEQTAFNVPPCLFEKIGVVFRYDMLRRNYISNRNKFSPSGMKNISEKWPSRSRFTRGLRW